MKKKSLNSFHFQNKQYLKVLFSICALVLMSTHMCWGQSKQLTGQFPHMDGGLEGQAGTITTSGIDSAISGIKVNSGSTGNNITNWTANGSSVGTYSYIVNNSANARSGNMYVHLYVTGTSALIAPVSFSNYPIINKKYIIQCYYNTLSSTATTYSTSGMSAVCVNTYSNLTPPSTTAANANFTQTITNKVTTNYPIDNTWRKFYTSFTYTYTNATSASILAGYAGFRSNNAIFTGRFDDFVIYEPTEFDGVTGEGLADVIAPDAPTAPVVSGLDVSWTAPATGVDGGGYMVVRYATTPNADNNPNVNGIYAVGNTITNGTGSLVGTVVYTGTATSFTDAVPGSVAGSDKYRIYTVDKAFNYSNAAVTSLNAKSFNKELDITVYSKDSKIYFSNIKSSTQVNIYNTLGSLLKTIKIDGDASLDINQGVYIINVKSAEGEKSVKIIVK
ncbi:T9SS type A sorting domain-containing protein [Flavobacterium alvei]|uniref:T9SS type A sorting domain-containing protein n=1 Tax=Flavobacterium alvei TaxID=2080416 RepID=UPI0026E91C1F|nr:T9SS type A sorting domain-containing protein [Flavobacterium alvei]